MIREEQAGAFDKLLGWLHPDREEAGVVYEQLRVKLLRLFEHHGCWSAEDCADETLRRVAQKLAEGVEILAGEPYVYCRGVARNVMLEEWRQQERVADALDELPPQRHPAFHPDEAERQEQERWRREHLLECLDRCLEALPPDHRQLFLEYHQDERRAKIDHRTALAEQLGIEITALRNRLTRLRKKVEACASECAREQK